MESNRSSSVDKQFRKDERDYDYVVRAGNTNRVGISRHQQLRATLLNCRFGTGTGRSSVQLWGRKTCPSRRWGAKMPCDPFEMALVHRGFRRELHNAAGLVRGVTPGDNTRAAVVCEHIDFMMTAVHFHHSAEDGVVWPRLSARAPSRAAELTRMEDAHRTIDHACERVRSTAVSWAETGDCLRADELISVIDEFVSRVDEHFDDEEHNVVPLIAEYLSPKEWRKFLAHGSAAGRERAHRRLAGRALQAASAEVALRLGVGRAGDGQRFRGNGARIRCAVQRRAVELIAARRMGDVEIGVGDARSGPGTSVRQAMSQRRSVAQFA